MRLSQEFALVVTAPPHHSVLENNLALGGQFPSQITALTALKSLYGLMQQAVAFPLTDTHRVVRSTSVTGSLPSGLSQLSALTQL